MHEYSELCQTEGISEPAHHVNAFINTDPKRFSWDHSDKVRLARGETYDLNERAIFVGSYRPFTKQNVYCDRRLNNRIYQLGRIFPTPKLHNVGFYVTGVGSDKPFSVLATDALPDLAFWGSSNGQFFPRYTYVAWWTGSVRRRGRIQRMEPRG